MATARRRGMWAMAAGWLWCWAAGAAPAVPGTGPASAGWSQWRGPARDGTTPATAGAWPARRAWSANVGSGCTSPLLADGRVFTLGWSQGPDGRGQDTVACLDARTGMPLWQQRYPSPTQGRHRVGDEGAYGGPSATPALDPRTGRLFTLGIDGDLICWSAADGARHWHVNLYERYRAGQRPNVGGGRRDFGYTSSPLLLGGSVVVEVGSPEGTVMAFDAATGQRRWASACTRPAGHTSGPVALTVGNLPCLATLTLTHLVLVRTDAGHEGQTLAEYPWQTDYGCNIPTPAVARDGARSLLILTGGYNTRRTECLEVTAEGITRRWQSPRHAVVASPVVAGECVYLVGGPVTCLDLGDGALRWSGGNFGDGSLAATADGRLVVFGNGRCALLEARPSTGRYSELHVVKDLWPATCYPHVAVGEGRIVCKDRAGKIVCLDTSPPEAASAPTGR